MNRKSSIRIAQHSHRLEKAYGGAEFNILFEPSNELTDVLDRCVHVDVHIEIERVVCRARVVEYGTLAHQRICNDRSLSI